MVEEHRNLHSEHHRIGSSSDVDCDSRRNYKVKGKRNIQVKKRRSKVEDFWKIYGYVIVRLSRVTNYSSGSPSKSSPSPPPPPSTSSSSSNCNVVEFEEARLALDLANRVDSERLVEEVESNTTMNGIHSLRYNPPDNPSTSTSTTPNGIFKQKTKDDFLRTITSPLSRITSRRSPSPSPRTSSSSVSRRSVSPLTFVHKCITGRKTSSSIAADPEHPSPATAPSTLSRNASQRTTPTTTSTATTNKPASLTRDASQRSNATTATASSSVFSRNPSERSTTPIMFSNSTGRKVKPPPVQKNLECTLEELFYGCTKTVKVTRDVLTDRGQIVQEEEILSIEVKPGWRKGTKIKFEGMGNERLGAEPADVTFVIAEKRHSLFRREGDDLEIAIEIPLVQALTGCDISIPLMSETGETMNLMIQDIVYPGYKRVIPGQGMPKSKQVNTRGNLRVTFLVEFPAELTEEQRSQVVSILEGSS